MGQLHTITYCNKLPEPGQFFCLFESTGWNKKYQLMEKDLAKAIEKSWYVCSAYAGDELVGFGRVVSDGVLHAMIYEMIVLPAFQGLGIGANILTQLVQACKSANIRDIQLFCAEGKRGFYEKYGFRARPNSAPGMALMQN